MQGKTSEQKAVLKGLEDITFTAEILDNFWQSADGFAVADTVVQEQDDVVFFTRRSDGIVIKILGGSVGGNGIFNRGIPAADFVSRVFNGGYKSVGKSCFAAGETVQNGIPFGKNFADGFLAAAYIAKQRGG